ncbi:MAG: response regulator [Massilia sp.]|nr:response regulator [Massilia sp.]
MTGPGWRNRTAHAAGVAGHVPDIALLDIGLPGMNGYELLAALRARPGWAHTAFAALSGYGQPEDRARSLGAGFSAHLVKPPAPQELAGLLDALAQHAAGETITGS